MKTSAFVASGGFVNVRNAKSGLCRRSPRSAVIPRRIVRCSAEESILETTDTGFEKEVLGSEVPVLVDFYAQWCGPCKLLNPVLEWAADEYGSGLKVFKIDADKNLKTVDKYSINALPTLVLFKDGEVRSQIVGAVAKARVAEFLKQNV